MSEAADAWPAVKSAPQAPVSQPDKFYVVENKTARSIQIAPTEAARDVTSLIIPPFGARRISEKQYHCFDFRRWEDPGLIVSYPEPPLEERKAVGRFSQSMDERNPLMDLDGIDLYDRARLSEEGVENIEHLAYYNLIDLLVQTRIPARRLADMVDQAILYLHLRGSAPPVLLASNSSDPLPAATDETANKPMSTLDYLRGYGIRTATDLMHVWRTPDRPSDFEAVLRAQSPEFADRVNVIVNALEDADWIPQLRYRRAQVTQLQEKPVTNPHDFFEIEATSAEQA